MAKTITVPCLRCDKWRKRKMYSGDKTNPACEACGGSGNLVIEKGKVSHALSKFSKVRLECINSSSAKFYEVDRDGFTVRMRWGRIGSNGQTDEKTFSTLSGAINFARDKRDEKLNRGYVEVKGASSLLDRQTGIPFGPAKQLITTRGTAAHFHACSECYLHKGCEELGCTIEPDLTLDDGSPCGSHIFCDDCASQLASMRLDGGSNDDDLFLRALGPALQEE